MTRILVTMLFVLLLAMTAVAEVPNLISYQGRLTNLAGTPYNGTKPVKFAIYEKLGVPIWSSGSVTVTFTDGLFSVQLGASPQPSLPFTYFGSDSLLTLGITVDTDPEISPRTRLTCVPFSLCSQNGGGWVYNAPFQYPVDTNNTVRIGTLGASVADQLTVLSNYATANTVAGRFINDRSGFFNNAVRATNASTGGIAALFVQGNNPSVVAEPGAISAHSQTGPCLNAFTEGTATSAIQARFMPSTGRCLNLYCDSAADAIWSRAYGGGYGLRSENGKGIYVQSDSLYAAEFHSSVLSGNAHVTHAEFSGSGSADAIAVYGKSVPGDNWGVGGFFEGGYRGVYGYANQPGSGGYTGVYGDARGDGPGTKYGVFGLATGTGGGKYGVYGSASVAVNSYAGYFSGNCNVTGTLTKGAGAFKIDHPLDPENKYLQHSFVESPDMKNIYDGVVTLDAGGNAVVTLPDWFDALNDNFRYQLTCIGGYAPVYVASEVSGNQFSIGGGSAGLKVSWQVTGVRKDAYAQAHRIQIEVAKTGDEKNHYLHSVEMGKPKELGIDWARDHESSLSGADHLDASKQSSSSRTNTTTRPVEPKETVSPPPSSTR